MGTLSNCTDCTVCTLCTIAHITLIKFKTHFHRNQPKLYRAVMEDVLNNVREAFLDEGVDEQVLHELKQVWEKKITETKAVDNNAREPETVPIAKQSNRSNANSSHSRNSQPHKEPAQPTQALSQSVTQVPQSVSHVTNPHMQSVTNHPVQPGLQQVHLQPSNVVLGPSGINYTTGAESVSIGHML